MWSLLVEWSSASLVTSWSHVSLLLVEVVVHGLVLLHDVQKLLKDLGHVWVGSKISKVESTGLLGLILFKIGLIHGILNLNLSLLLDLVVVDHKGLTIISRVVQGLLGKGCRVWLLEADKGKASIYSLLELDVLDGTELLEKVGEII